MAAIISKVEEGSIAEEKGLKKGDTLLSINNHPVRDVIDYLFYSKEETLHLKINRDNKTHTIMIKRRGNSDIGIEFRSFRIRRCRNRCIFCFVDQLPKGMRRSLYIKDDDYRMSFLYGNYITLTNLTPADRRRIAEQRLSPLYVSIHSTDNTIRRKMLGNPKAGDIIEGLRELTSYRIRIHGQIVVCPGINDGENLQKTLRELQRFYPYLQSVALVPVGLTRYRKGSIRPVNRDDALRVIEIAKDFRRKFKKRHGDPLVHVADEFYIKAGVPFPSYKEYGDFPQIENGVGLVASFLASTKRLRLPKKLDETRVAVITGVSFAPYLEDFINRLRAIEGLSIDLIKVKNEFFGPSVTVTGLLTGKDIFKAVVGTTKAECLLVPDVTLKHDEPVFLDNVTIKDIEEGLGIHVIPVESTPEGLVRGIINANKR
jgi:putative radical SAM enzyme (TIGR03279 family)